jgi:hypothetical protein
MPRKKIRKPKRRLLLYSSPEQVQEEPISPEPGVPSPKRQTRPEAGQITIGELIQAQEQGRAFEEILREPSTVERESPATITRKVIPYAEFAYRRRERQQKLHLQRIRERRLRESL